ncbi:MAG TPA: UDP-N-acetylmuramoyl-tripeptide--D-alanyl-D-alanine ligase [Burkholderiales bacterium]|jgi:UDP-N-acetylmuramoyl-tripeptide--D-alanyl-D-alanine ligase|nr:UDP-N-acetylmuramoyl-tripeptide--D-alanyl-D-alanine ligase [Burkholderiales bacterium]
MLDLVSAAQALGAHRVGANAEFTRVTTDSRDIRPGDLFVGIRGERFDGQEFAAQALAAGAVAAMVNEIPRNAGADARLLVVSDTRAALGRLASHWRARFAMPLIAITGSNGKTTVKEMLAAILRQSAGENGVLATAGNFNNDIGMPLTLLQLRAQHRYAVIEMGMNHLGEIAYLSRLAKPTTALINNAGTAHIGEVGSTEAIARAKGEIFEGLDEAGTAIINSDDAFADLWRGLAKPRLVVDFGLEKRAAVTARFELLEAGSLMTVVTPESQFVTTLKVPGLHNVKNALAAATAGYALGIEPKAIASGIASCRGMKGRLQRRRLPSGATVIDDTYNANPESMKAAIAVLAAQTGRRVFVMGDMGELGDAAAAMHAAVGVYAKRAGVEHLYALGDLSAMAVRSFGEGGTHFSTVQDLVAAIAGLMGRDTTLLIKGSRFMRMERVVEALGAMNGEQTEKGGA